MKLDAMKKCRKKNSKFIIKYILENTVIEFVVSTVMRREAPKEKKGIIGKKKNYL